MMKPTMKLRWKQFNGFGTPQFSQAAYCISGTDTYFVLQQWWEGSSMGTMNMGWGGEMPLGTTKGEWRDIPIEVEK